MSEHWKPRTHWRETPPPKPLRRSRRKRPSWGGTSLVALGGIALGLAYASAPVASGAGTTVQPAAVSVIDGDTFHYGGDKIRIADIDTPEVRGRCAYEKALAAQATQRLEELLAAGPFELQPIPGRDEDRYGRKLRVVTRNGRSLGDRLVEEGLARTWTGRREPWCGAGA